MHKVRDSANLQDADNKNTVELEMSLKDSVDNLKNVRVSLLPEILWALLIVSIPAMIADAYKLIESDHEPVLYFHSFVMLALWLLALNRKRLGFDFSAGLLILISYSLAVAGLVSFGLTGAATYGFFGAAIMGAVFFGSGLAALMVLLSVLAFFVVGWAANFGYLKYDVDYAAYISEPGPWLATMTTYILYVGISIVGFVRLIKTLASSLREQRSQTDELQRLNENLHREIAEREQAVKLHRENTEKLRVVTSSALDAVIMLDENGRVVLWNPAAEKIFGYSAEEMLGRDVHPIIAPLRYHEAIKRGFESFCKNGKGDAVGRVLELDARHRDGHEFAVEMAVSGILMHGCYWSTAIIRNIEERKRAEYEKNEMQIRLQQAAKMEAVGRLAGGVAHDFNNLLTSISGNLALALMEMRQDERCIAIINEAQKAADSAALLTRQLLSFSRRQIVEPLIMDVNRHIMHMQKMLMRMVGEDVEVNLVFWGRRRICENRSQSV